MRRDWTEGHHLSVKACHLIYRQESFTRNLGSAALVEHAMDQETKLFIELAGFIV